MASEHLTKDQRRKPKKLKELASDCATDLAANDWWSKPLIEEAFKRGWHARRMFEKRRNGDG